MAWRIAVALLAIALAATGRVAFRHMQEVPPAAPPRIHATLEPPGGAELGAGDTILDAALSSDSREIAFVATADGVARLWRRRLDADRADPLAGTEGASMPAWKRGNRVVSFFAAGSLRQIALDDGAVRTLAAAPAPAGATWMPDGSLLFGPDGRGVIRRLRNGMVEGVTSLRDGDLGHLFPEAIGDTGDFLYIAQRAAGRRVIRRVRGGEDLDLTSTSGHAAIVADRLVHVVDGTLTVQRLDAETGSIAGRGAPLAFNVGSPAAGRAFFAASPRVVVWAAGARRARELVWLDADGMRAGNVSEPGDYWHVRLSPDDRMAAVTMVDPLLRTLDVFAVTTDGSTAAPWRVSSSLSADSDPVWSPDGSRVVFRSLQGGQPNLLARPPRFSEEPDQVVLRSELDETASDWRGDLVLFHAPGNGTGLDIWVLNVRNGERQPLTRRGFNESDARWSPDGRWIAYVSDEPGRPDIVVERWPQDGRTRRATLAGGTRPRWRRDGRAIFFMRDGALMQASVEERAGDVVFGAARRVAALEGAPDYDTAYRTDRILAIVPMPRAQDAKAGMIVDW